MSGYDTSRNHGPSAAKVASEVGIGVYINAEIDTTTKNDQKQKLQDKGIYAFKNVGTGNYLSLAIPDKTVPKQGKNVVNISKLNIIGNFSDINGWNSATEDALKSKQKVVVIMAKWRYIMEFGGARLYTHAYGKNKLCLDQRTKSSEFDTSYNLDTAQIYENTTDSLNDQLLHIEYNKDSNNTISIRLKNSSLYLTAGTGTWKDDNKDGRTRDSKGKKDIYPGNVYWAEKDYSASQKWTFEQYGKWDEFEYRKSPEKFGIEMMLPKNPKATGYRKRVESFNKATNLKSSVTIFPFIPQVSFESSGYIRFQDDFLPQKAYVVAMGSYYNLYQSLGHINYIELTNGNKFYVVCGDRKDDVHTNPSFNENYAGDVKGMYTTAGKGLSGYDKNNLAYDFCIIEFVVHTKVVKDNTAAFNYMVTAGGNREDWPTRPDVTQFSDVYKAFDGAIKKIVQLNFTAFLDEEWHISYQNTQDYKTKRAEKYYGTDYIVTRGKDVE